MRNKKFAEIQYRSIAYSPGLGLCISKARELFKCHTQTGWTHMFHFIGLLPMKPLFRAPTSVTTLGLFCSVLSCFSGVTAMRNLELLDACLLSNNCQMGVISTDQK